MTRFTRSLLALLSLNSSTLASPALLKPQLLGRDVCAGNTATTRSQWCNYDIDTDADTTIPNTGVTREYWFDLSEVNVAPDGVPRYAIAINGSIPGPTIVADWGTCLPSPSPLSAALLSIVFRHGGYCSASLGPASELTGLFQVMMLWST